jgi:hypothetical protein
MPKIILTPKKKMIMVLTKKPTKSIKVMPKPKVKRENLYKTA